MGLGEKTMEDPYIKLLDTMTEAGSGKAQGTVARVGTVISVSPLKVQVEGLELDKGDILVNEVLLPGYSRSASLGEASGTLNLSSRGIKAKDKVLLMSSADMQQYYLVCVLKEA